MSCSMDDSTGFCLSDFKNMGKPGLLGPVAGAIVGSG